MTKLYVGSRDYKPKGYLTLDIDPTNSPDIVGDITNLIHVPDGFASEIIASHVLEHLEWPDSFLAICELTRILQPNGILKLAVPDMSLLSRLLFNGDAPFYCMAMIYGLGGRQNPFEKHRYGFTARMLTDILTILGYTEFDWWNSTIPDASNGWIPQPGAKNIALSLNISARKTNPPIDEPKRLYEAINSDPMEDVQISTAQLRRAQPLDSNNDAAVKLYQRIHFQLIEALQRIQLLERQLSELSQPDRKN